MTSAPRSPHRAPGMSIRSLTDWQRAPRLPRSGAPSVGGVPPTHLGFRTLVAITVMVAVATRALGALPVFAFSVLPALAALLGALSGGRGYLVAFFRSFPVGACQAVTAGLFVVAAIPVRLLRGGE